jgi:hypothetical protein
MDMEHAASASEALVVAPKIHSTNLVLSQHGSTHDARFDCDIEISLAQNAGRLRGEDFGNGHELCMPGTLHVTLVFRYTYIVFGTKKKLFADRERSSHAKPRL